MQDPLPGIEERKHSMADRVSLESRNGAWTRYLAGTWQPTKSRRKVYPPSQSPDTRYLDNAA
jgi:hypothetical protein